MSGYLHGVYAQIQQASSLVAELGRSAIVYVGTAPVHRMVGSASAVNTPIVVGNIAEAKSFFGYDDNWADYTLCEAMHVHFEQQGVGPLILINVLNPAYASHKSATQTTDTKTPADGKIVYPTAKDMILDSIVITTTDEPAETKVLGTDYTLSYNAEKGVLTIAEVTSGSLGTDPLSVAYHTIKPSGVVANDVIGADDGLGTCTGIHAIKSVYQKTGYVPSYLGVPGFSGTKTVHDAMKTVSVKINGHWDCYMFADIPLLDGSTPITLATAKTWKDTNGYTAQNETVFFPMATGTDGKQYHLSVLAAANFQKLLLAQSGIPYKTASNTACEIISNLWLGSGSEGRAYDDQLINEKLTKNGIASACYVGGRWAIWGCHSADYDQSNANQINVAETNRMMLFYISNEFQSRRADDVDKPMTANDLATIIAEEQGRIDALVAIGALTYGKVSLTATAQAQSDLMNGDYSFTFVITTTPLAKSLTAVVTWTDAGFATYYENLNA